MECELQPKASRLFVNKQICKRYIICAIRTKPFPQVIIEIFVPSRAPEPPSTKEPVLCQPGSPLLERLQMAAIFTTKIVKFLVLLVPLHCQDGICNWKTGSRRGGPMIEGALRLVVGLWVTVASVEEWASVVD